MRSDLGTLGRLHGGSIEFKLEDEQDSNNYREKALYAREEVKTEARRHKRASPPKQGESLRDSWAVVHVTSHVGTETRDGNRAQIMNVLPRGWQSLLAAEEKKYGST